MFLLCFPLLLIFLVCMITYSHSYEMNFRSPILRGHLLLQIRARRPATWVPNSLPERTPVRRNTQMHTASTVAPASPKQSWIPHCTTASEYSSTFVLPLFPSYYTDSDIGIVEVSFPSCWTYSELASEEVFSPFYLHWDWMGVRKSLFRSNCIKSKSESRLPLLQTAVTVSSPKLRSIRFCR